MHGMVDSCSPFNAQEKVVVCFIQVDHSEPMDLVVAGLFLYHHGHNFLPSVKRSICDLLPHNSKGTNENQ